MKEKIKKLLYIQYGDAYAHNPEFVEKRIKKLNTIYQQIKKIEKQREYIRR